MGSRGPAPTPLAILQARGSKCDRAADNPPSLPGRPGMPKRLTPNAKRVWKRLIPMLERMGVLNQIDGFQLERYCTVFARWREAEDFIAKNGSTYTVKGDTACYVGEVNGVRVVGFMEYPQVKRAAQLDETLRKIEAQFGMTPSARARISADQGQQQDNQNGKLKYFSGAG